MSSPLSVRNALQKFAPPGQGRDLSVVAQKLGLATPVSLRNVGGILNSFPTTKSFSANVVTPSGTPLGGSVTLSVSSDGTYAIEFIMHSSSIFAAFDFQLRAYLTGPGLPNFFFYHEGHVSPKGTDDTHQEPGSNPMLSTYWNTIANSADFSVAHDYQWSGVVGGVANLVDDLLNIGAAAVGGTLGAVIALTQEALGWLKINLGPGGTIGVIAGVLIFAVGEIAGVGTAEAFVLSTIAGVAAGAVTNALFDYRPMSAAEIALAREVFGETLPYEKVTFTNLNTIGGRAFTAPGVDGMTYCNLGNQYQNTLGSSPSAYPGAGEVMIHELTHAWQIANNSFLPGFVCSGIVNQTTNTLGDNVYAYGAAGPAWASFNLEQQAQIVNQWFSGHDDPTGHSAAYPPRSTAGPYYQYIVGNILTGSAGFSTSWL